MAVVGVVGLDELKARLMRIHEELAGKLLIDAMHAGAEVVRNAMAERAPSERLKKSIIVYQRKHGGMRQTAEQLSLLIGVERKTGFHAFWVENGFTFTSGEKVKKRSKTGTPLLRFRTPDGRWLTVRKETFGRKIPGRPFARPAFDASREAAFAAAEAVIARGVESLK